MSCEIMPSRCEVLFPRNEAECEGSFAVSPVSTAFGRDCALSWFIPGNFGGGGRLVWDLQCHHSCHGAGARRAQEGRPGLPIVQLLETR